eukprot:scaffold151726_cov13-Tisochrysis_lutea.AAC.1
MLPSPHAVPEAEPEGGREGDISGESSELLGPNSPPTTADRSDARQSSVSNAGGLAKGGEWGAASTLTAG